MDAPILRFSLIFLSTLAFTGANYQTANFTVSAPTAEIAEQIGKAAETYRRDLAVFWLDRPLPNWSRPCTLRVRPGSMGAGGETKFQFAGGEVTNWNMYVQGSLERILDSVLPHEVNHTIFACHFRRPLPRWADEGAATLFEHRSEQVKQLGLLNQVIKSDREFISLRNLLTMKEYPKGYRPMLILYAEGFALADFLVQQGGRKRYLKFLTDGERMGWTQAIKANYHHGGVDSLQKNWQSWVLAGMPKLRTPDGQLLAGENGGPQEDSIRPAILDEYVSAATFRSQSPDARSDSSVVSVAPRVSRPGSVALGKYGPRPVNVRNKDVETSPQSSSSVFIGLPVTRTAQPVSMPTSKVLGNSHRGASIEAPRPRDSTSKSPGLYSGSKSKSAGPLRHSDRRFDDRFQGQRQANAARVPGLERTQLTEFFDRSNSNLTRKHLPQERRLVTGSIPQWAGFPGQKELF